MHIDLHNKIKLIKKNIYIPIILVVAALFYHDITFRKSIEIELISQTPEYIQVFYDIGAGYKQHDSKTNSITPSSNYITSRFIYPYSRLKSFRFDPAMRKTKTTVRSITVNDQKYSAQELFDTVVKSQQVEYSVINDVLEIVSLGSDPYLVFDIRENSIPTYSLSFILSSTNIIVMVSIILFGVLKIRTLSLRTIKVMRFKGLFKVFPFIFLFVFFSFASFTAYNVKLWDYPDEIGHYSYVKDLSKFELNKIGEAKMDKQALIHWGLVDEERSNWIVQHPPLYYLLLAPILYFTQNYSLTIQVAILRSATSIISFMNLIVIYKLLYEISRSSLFSSVGVLIIALLPNYLFLSSSINNDLLVSLFTSMSILFLTKAVRSASNLTLWLSTLFLSLAVLTKMTALTLVPAQIVIVSFLLIKNCKNSLKNDIFSYIKKIVFICSPYILPLIWHIRLYLIYGSPVATNSITQDYSITKPVTLYEFLSQQTIPLGILGTFISSLGWSGYGHNFFLISLAYW